MLVCDKCRARLDENDFKITFDYWTVSNSLKGNATKQYEVCEDCFNQIKKLIEQYIKE